MKQTNNINRKPTAETVKYFDDKVLHVKAYTLDRFNAFRKADPKDDQRAVDDLSLWYGTTYSKAQLDKKFNWFTSHLQAMLEVESWCSSATSEAKKKDQMLALYTVIAPQVNLSDNRGGQQSTFNLYLFARQFWRCWESGTEENRLAVLYKFKDISKKEYDGQLAAIAKAKAEKEADKAKKEADRAAKKAEREAAKKQKADADTWTCSCGAVNESSFNFCPVCSAKRPEPKIVVPETWTCSCGAVNESGFNFCPVCSAKRPEPKVVEAPKAEAPKAAAKSTRKSTKATRSSKATKPAVPEEKVEFDAPTLFDMSDAYGKGSFGTVDLEEQKKLKRIDDTLREFVDALLEGASINGKIKAYKIVLAAGKEALDENAAKVNAKATTADKNYNKK